MIDNHDTMDKLEKGHEQYRNGNYHAALLHYCEAGEAQAENPVIWGYIGLAHLTLENLNEAQEYLKKSIEMGDEATTHKARAHLGIVEHKLGNYPQAIGLLETFRTEIDFLSEPFESDNPELEKSRLTVLSQAAQACYWLGISEFNIEDYDWAIRDLLLYKEHKQGTTRNLADIVIVQAYVRTGELSLAERYLNENIKEANLKDGNWYDMGNMYNDLSLGFGENSRSIIHRQKYKDYSHKAVNSFLTAVECSKSEILTTQLHHKITEVSMRLG